MLGAGEMQVEFYKSVDIEGVVDVSVEDIANALSQQHDTAKDVCLCGDGATEQCKRHHVQRFVSAVWQCLAGVSDDMIERLSIADKKVINAGLQKQADRYLEQVK